MCPTGGTFEIDGNLISWDPSAGTASCVPYGSDTTESTGGFLMYPSTASDEASVYGTSFSTCSAAGIGATLDARGSCLTVPNPCGSGGECCTPEGALKPAGAVCRAADATVPCAAEASCDGLHPECPMNAFVEDGAPCDQDAADPANHGVCHSGTCSHTHSLWCANNGQGLSCSTPGYECVRACMYAGECLYGSDACNSNRPLVDAFVAYNLQLGYDWGGFLYWLGVGDGGGTCELADAGTPCVIDATHDGTCTSTGACRACAAEGCALLYANLEGGEDENKEEEEDADDERASNEPPPLTPPNPSPPTPAPTPAPTIVPLSLPGEGKGGEERGVGGGHY